MRIRWPFGHKIKVEVLEGEAVDFNQHGLEAPHTFRTESAEKYLYLKCGGVLVGVRLVGERRTADGYAALTCEVATIDFEPLRESRAISRKISFYDRSPTNEEIFLLIKETIEMVPGIPKGGIMPVSDRYVASHRKIVNLKQKIQKEGESA